MKLYINLLISALVVWQTSSFSQVTTLEPGKTIEVKLLKGETHHYQFQLKKGTYLECNINTQSVVLAIDLLNSSGEKIKTFNTSLQGYKDKLISIEAAQTDNYQLNIYPLLDIPGVPDSLRAQLAEENQGNYIITNISVLSSSEYEQKLAQEKKEEAEFINWITTNAREIKSVDANRGFDDLQPLKIILKDVRVVGLGEATHGTSEFFRMKHRMLEFLVKEMGYTSFYIEASMTRCRYINDYVLYGTGNLDTAAAIHGFYVWRVEEVKNMIEWMRKYNASVSDAKKIKFFGYDLQINDFGFKALKEFYSIVKAEKIPVLDSLQIQFDSASALLKSLDTYLQSTRIFQSVYQQCLEMLNDIVLNEGSYQYLAGKEKYNENLMNMKLIVQQAESYKNEEDYTTRDYYMAQNILSLLKQEKPDTKVLLWAHNGHIAKTRGMMGRYLADILKNKYYALGFEFYSGSFQAKNADIDDSLDVMVVGNPPDNSLPFYLNKTKQDKFFIDFRNTGTDTIKYFSKEYEMHSIGSEYSLNWPATYTAKLEIYDGLIFIKNTTAAKNLTKVYFK